MFRRWRKMRPSGSWSALGALLGPSWPSWRPLGAPKGPKEGPKEGPKRPPRRPTDAPSWPQTHHGPPKAAKRRPRAPKRAQQGPQESRMPLEAPKSAQDTPKRPPRGRIVDVCWLNSIINSPISASFLLRLTNKLPQPLARFTGQHQWGAAVARGPMRGSDVNLLL